MIKDKPIFSNGPGSLPKNLPDCPILDKRFIENFMVADWPFEKDLQRPEICLLVIITCVENQSHHERYQSLWWKI